MFDTLVFEGPIEELIERKEEFAGMRVGVFAAPETEEEYIANLPPPNAIRDKAHEEELMMSALQSPLETIDENYWENIQQEVQARLAARKTAK